MPYRINMPEGKRGSSAGFIAGEWTEMSSVRQSHIVHLMRVIKARKGFIPLQECNDKLKYSTSKDYSHLGEHTVYMWRKPNNIGNADMQFAVSGGGTLHDLMTWTDHIIYRRKPTKILTRPFINHYCNEYGYIMRVR